MGDGSGTACAPTGRARALWVVLWANRTKITGYAGVIGGSVEMGILGGQHIGLVLLGAAVAAIGHYNDRHPDL
jgi:hypothetical protein